MATDQEIRDRGFKYIPKQEYLLNPFELPENQEPVTNSGIVNTNAFTNMGGNNSYNQAGNAFGYGSQIEPGGSYGSYDSINYTGGLPGNVQQYGIGRQFEDPSASPIGETYSYEKKVPGFMRAGAAFIPGGNFLLNLAEKKMNDNRDQSSGNYRIGGLDQSMKGYYDNLAGSGMLFDGPGGVKTLTGKNFAGKGYLEGQMDLAKGFGFDTMTDKEIEDAIAAEAARHGKKHGGNKGFKYKQMLEASQMYKTNKAQEENKERMANLAAAESRRESARQYNPAVHGSNNYGLGGDGQQSYSNMGTQGFGVSATGGGPVSNKTGRGRTDYMKGGRAGYFFGGRVNYKVGGRTDAESQYGADSVGSYDSSANQSDRGQSYGINNNPPVSTGDNNKIVTTDFINKNPSLTVDYTDPRNYASIYGKIGFDNILDNDDLTVGGNVTGEFGPIGYNTNFTDKGITGTNLTAGNFNANISPDMQVQNIGYNNNINGINYGVNTDFDNTMFTAGVKFKNGGLASIL